eukprot:CAMPEP_0172758222 /NCGR_PEP_ID=MMETSP1074-20121228/165315_1 /TAXON_ID=2916 /ORGANISM="Ceratium fusus, Strain PA161109" /LENGTH=79 /DNA_ID=CAMNT_0013591769 /DNA_START=26 /DNA_END=265 /DNA_ORIENTATION=+
MTSSVVSASSAAMSSPGSSKSKTATFSAMRSGELLLTVTTLPFWRFQRKQTCAGVLPKRAAAATTGPQLSTAPPRCNGL